MLDYEKLGLFYLGKHYDPDRRARTDSPLLYDAKDLVTHAVCVGMTGSGKTGLCIGLLEEAAIDGIPVIAIDPKGDLGNLLLTFPDLRPADFQPWVNPDDARRKGLDLPDFAAQQAALWTKGLADWQQDGDRIRRLRAAADFTIYTPGSSAGVPVSVLRSLDAPPRELIDDRDLFRERTATSATAILALLGLDADPVRSRDHILLSTIIDAAWRSGRSLDLAALITLIQKPPVERIGVIDLETFYPAADRFALAMALNNLLASPSFSAWSEGQPLDIQSMLYTSAGKPRVAIFSIAHLADAERMFFVTLLLGQLLTWTRRQSGTTSLRAILYMDEIAGYCPPSAAPPAKAPLLTLMKQARAFGVGVVLATQNPVDLDYKGLSNAGTWFIGRLQTERDKARVLDGLEGAAAGASSSFNRDECDRLISSLGARVFLMNNVHDDAPTLFETRWCLSYLRGPLTRDQIKHLTPAAGTPSPAPVLVPTPEPTRIATPAPAAPIAASASAPPPVPPEITQVFLPIRLTPPHGAPVRYHPAVLGLADILFRDDKLAVDLTRKHLALAPITDALKPVDWEHAESLDLTQDDLDRAPIDSPADFAPLPAPAVKPRSYDAWKRDLTDALFRTARLDLLRAPSLALTSRPGESERDFRARLTLAAREERDRLVERLRAKHAPKLATLQERLRRAEQTVEVQQAQARDAKVSTAVSVGAALFGALLGRRSGSGAVSRAGSAVRGVSRSARESADVGRAEETVEAVRAQLAALQQQVDDDAAEIAHAIDPRAEPFEAIAIRPRKTAIKVHAAVLAWCPYLAVGLTPTPAWRSRPSA